MDRSKEKPDGTNAPPEHEQDTSVRMLTLEECFEKDFSPDCGYQRNHTPEKCTICTMRWRSLEPDCENDIEWVPQVGEEREDGWDPTGNYYLEHFMPSSEKIMEIIEVVRSRKDARIPFVAGEMVHDPLMSDSIIKTFTDTNTDSPCPRVQVTVIGSFVAISFDVTVANRCYPIRRFFNEEYVFNYQEALFRKGINRTFFDLDRMPAKFEMEVVDLGAPVGLVDDALPTGLRRSLTPEGHIRLFRTKRNAPTAQRGGESNEGEV